MGIVLLLKKFRHEPHFCVPTPDNCIHIIPTATLISIAKGDMPIEQLEDWLPIIQTILKEWMEFKLEKKK